MSLSLQEVLEITGGRLVNQPASSSVRVERPSDLKGAKPSEISFFFSKEFQADLLQSAPGILITGEAFVGPLEKAGIPLWKTSAVVACTDPYRAMGQISKAMAGSILSSSHLPGGKSSRLPSFVGKVSPQASIHPSVKMGQGVSIAAFVTVEEGVVLGDRVTLYPGVFVGSGSVIGDDSVLFANVSVYDGVQIGKRVRIHSGSVIGADGFGYAAIRKGTGLPEGHEKIYHYGGVVIADDVEVGALSAIDRGTFASTQIASSVKIDNLCQVGHNSVLDEGAVICGCSGLAGGTHIGSYAMVLGAVSVVNKASVGAGAIAGAGAVVSKDVPAGTQVSGNPMREHRESLKLQALLSRMLKKREPSAEKKGNES